MLQQTRTIVSVSGEDAASFLQNMSTCDVRKVGVDNKVYGLFLGPQGRILHEMIVTRDKDGAYLLDVDAGRKDELIKRLMMYRLRSKVEIVDTGEAPPYARESDDEMIVKGIPPVAAMRFDKDFPADLNLDVLGAIDWDKGCFIGQELVARMHHRGLAKKRLMIVEGENLRTDSPLLTAEGAEAGQMRCVAADGGRGLALVRLELVPGGRAFYEGREVKVNPAPYILKES